MFDKTVLDHLKIRWKMVALAKKTGIKRSNVFFPDQDSNFKSHRIVLFDLFVWHVNSPYFFLPIRILKVVLKHLFRIPSFSMKK
jgi:hypothetical protein